MAVKNVLREWEKFKNYFPTESEASTFLAGSTDKDISKFLKKQGRKGKLEGVPRNIRAGFRQSLPPPPPTAKGKPPTITTPTPKPQFTEWEVKVLRPLSNPSFQAEQYKILKPSRWSFVGIFFEENDALQGIINKFTDAFCRNVRYIIKKWFRTKWSKPYYFVTLYWSDGQINYSPKIHNAAELQKWYDSLVQTQPDGTLVPKAKIDSPKAGGREPKSKESVEVEKVRVSTILKITPSNKVRGSPDRDNLYFLEGDKYAAWK